MATLPNSRDIAAFNVVAVELSFRRAAERLSIDQSALSRRIRQLEDLLGYQLIRRTTREVSLTAAGEIFHEHTRLMGDKINVAVRAARIAAEGKAGSLKIGYMSFAAMEIMPNVVREFTSRYPDIQIELLYMGTQSQKIELSKNQLDAGFILGPFSDPQYETKHLISEPLVAIMSTDHRLATHSSVTLAEIARYPMVLGNRVEWDFFRLFIDDTFSRAGYSITVECEASNALGIMGLVSSGLGVSICSVGITNFQPNSVMIKLINDCDVEIPTLLTWNRAYKTPALMNFIAVAKELYTK